jgi:hypothetical protein
VLTLVRLRNSLSVSETCKDAVQGATDPTDQWLNGKLVKYKVFKNKHLHYKGQRCPRNGK